MDRSMKDLRTHRVIPSRHVTSPPRLGLVACLVGAIILPLGSGSALGQDVTSEAAGPLAWYEWLQQHRQLEYPMDASVAGGADTITVAGWLQDHLKLEYPDSQRG